MGRQTTPRASSALCPDRCSAQPYGGQTPIHSPSASSGKIVPLFRPFFLQYTKYFCEEAPSSGLNLSRNLLLPYESSSAKSEWMAGAAARPASGNEAAGGPQGNGSCFPGSREIFGEGAWLIRPALFSPEIRAWCRSHRWDAAHLQCRAVYHRKSDLSMNKL